MSAPAAKAFSRAGEDDAADARVRGRSRRGPGSARRPACEFSAFSACGRLRVIEPDPAAGLDEDRLVGCHAWRRLSVARESGSGQCARLGKGGRSAPLADRTDRRSSGPTARCGARCRRSPASGRARPPGRRPGSGAGNSRASRRPGRGRAGSSRRPRPPRPARPGSPRRGGPPCASGRPPAWRCEPAGAAGEAGPVQRLADIDIAEPGDQALVEQGRLERRPLAGEQAGDGGRRRVRCRAARCRFRRNAGTSRGPARGTRSMKPKRRASL